MKAILPVDVRNGTLVAIFAALLFLAVAGCGSVYPKGSVGEGASKIKKSIRGWTTCNGTTDDAEGVSRAMAAASHSAFTLVVDCPVRIHIGMDISRTIFIDDGTTVEFTGSGKFTVDNVMLPAFAIANSSNIALTDWNLEYDASMPVNPNVGGYEDRGHFVARSGAGSQPSGAFNDLRITPWLTANRAIKFDHSLGNATSMWANPTNTSAVFFIIGDTSNVTVTGMRMYVPAGAGGDRFVPMAFSLSKNFKSNQTVSVKTPITSEYVAIPHDLTFSNISLDGTYMGWQGNASNVLFENIRSHRYGDVQDANGQNAGGLNDWFAPPHLFYLNYIDTGDPLLFNKNIQIKNVVDDGPRIGTARNVKSGNACSLKIGCVECSVDDYRSTRPDGFMDVLSSNGLTVSNVTATYDSAFEDNQWPAWRFPSSYYTHVTFENIVLKDSAPVTAHPPIDGNNRPSNENIVFKNVQVEINRWSGTGRLVPDIAGRGNEVALDYAIAADMSHVTSLQRGGQSLMLSATPAKVTAGDSTVLTWTLREAGVCSASGTWSGALAAEGSRTVKLTSGGNYDFGIECQNAAGPSAVTVRIVVSK